MSTIDQISQVLSDHARNEIDEAEALRRVREITCASGDLPSRLGLVVNRARSEVERQRLAVRGNVESITHDAQRLATDLDARGPDVVSATWLVLHVKGLADAQARLADAREALRQLEQLVPG